MARLNEIASVSTGLTLRGRPDGKVKGNIKLMQLGDLDISGNIDFENMLAVEPDYSYERFLAEEGDLVFRGRGAGISVAVMPKCEEQIIVVAPLILIRTNKALVIPEYLQWFLQAQKAQKYYAVHVKGTSVMGVGKKDLENLEVDLPNVDTQKIIANLVKLHKEEELLLQRYQSARSQLINSFLGDLVEKFKKI